MKVQRLIYGAIGLWIAIASSSLAPWLPLPAFSTIGTSAIASPPVTVAFERMGLPRSVAHTVRRTFQRDYFEAQDEVLGTLPAPLANAVMRDAQEWFNTPELTLETTPDAPGEVGFQVESIEPVTWNECGGGSGPSLPMRGMCLNMTVSGWRMVVAGGGRSDPLRLVYYIPQGAEVGSWVPQPDGLQSLSEATQRRMLAQVAENAGISTSQLRLFWVEARFFDRCLNTHADAPSCGLNIRPGWVVQILVSQTNSGMSMQQPLWVYHTNLTGTDVRLISQGQWMPPPMVMPTMPQ